MVNHWEAPQWHHSQHFYSWYLTFEDYPALQKLAEDYDKVLAQFSLDVVPPHLLHLTLQSIGIADQIPLSKVQQIGEAGRKLGASEPFEITVGKAFVHPEAIVMLVASSQSLRHLRSRLRQAIAEVLGPQSVLESEEDFIPHIALAYSRAEGPGNVIVEALDAVDLDLITLPVTAVHLLEVKQDINAYRWNPIDTVRLSLASPPFHLPALRSGRQQGD